MRGESLNLFGIRRIFWRDRRQRTSSSRNRTGLLSSARITIRKGFWDPEGHAFFLRATRALFDPCADGASDISECCLLAVMRLRNPRAWRVAGSHQPHDCRRYRESLAAIDDRVESANGPMWRAGGSDDPGVGYHVEVRDTASIMVRTSGASEVRASLVTASAAACLPARAAASLLHPRWSAGPPG